MRSSLLGCVTAASVLVLAAAPSLAQRGPTGVGGGGGGGGGGAPAAAAPSVGGGPTGGGVGSGGMPGGGGSIGRGPTGAPGGAIVGSPGGPRGNWSGGNWSGGNWSGHGGRWHGRHHRHRGFAFGFAPYYGWGYDPFYYAQPACEMVRVRYTLPTGRRVWRWVERCY